MTEIGLNVEEFTNPKDYRTIKLSQIPFEKQTYRSPCEGHDRVGLQLSQIECDIIRQCNVLQYDFRAVSNNSRDLQVGGSCT